MFPLRTGSGVGGGVAGNVSQDQILIQSLTMAALHEIGQQAILDTSLLMFHQLAAVVDHYNYQGIPIPTNPDGTYSVYTPEEEKKIRSELRDVVMKFHILDPDGFASQLTPLIYCLQRQQPIPEDVLRDSPLLQRVFNTFNNYRDTAMSGDIKRQMDQILDFSLLENMSLQDQHDVIMASYKEDSDSRNVEIYMDDNVQCACEFCSEFFQILERINDIDRSQLNPIQELMARNYQF